MSELSKQLEHDAIATMEHGGKFVGALGGTIFYLLAWSLVTPGVGLAWLGKQSSGGQDAPTAGQTDAPSVL